MFIDVIDYSIFNELREMDDNDNREFTKGIVIEFLNQAATTLESMKKNV